LSDDLLNIIKTYSKYQLIEYIVAQDELRNYLHKQKSNLEETCKTLLDIMQMASEREYTRVNKDVIYINDELYKKINIEDLE
jgi:20S proteasome alpha/beta subunit